MSKNYQCPRCKSNKIINYDKTIECLDCKLEFDKEDLEMLEVDQILSIKEKVAFIRSIKN